MSATKTKKTTRSPKVAQEINTEAVIKETRANLGFKEVAGTSGTTPYISETKADYQASKGLLEKADLTFLTYQDALSTLMNDEKLKESLKGKWFYLAGSGLNKKLDLYTINKKGELVERKGEVSPEKTVRVWNGKNPLSLDVDSDDDVAQVDRRFYLDAYNVPSDVAPVVVGRAKSEQQATDAVLRKMEEAAANLEAGIAQRERLLRPT